jgi:glutathione S-transferase
MSDYTLYYWPLPFRGQFVRALLAIAGRSWTEVDDETISDLMSGATSETPIPFMGPPVLVESVSGFAISQMPAILLYLGETLDLLPSALGLRALSMKVVCDANDVLDEVTLNGGRAMWTSESWREFEPRLTKWMELWEDLGRRHNLKEDSGFLLGGDEVGISDVVTATLWSTMSDRLPRIAALLQETAPLTAALAKRVAALPPLVELAAQARRDYGDAWCGGKIEESLRSSLP